MRRFPRKIEIYKNNCLDIIASTKLTFCTSSQQVTGGHKKREREKFARLLQLIHPPLQVEWAVVWIIERACCAGLFVTRWGHSNAQSKYIANLAVSVILASSRDSILCTRSQKPNRHRIRESSHKSARDECQRLVLASGHSSNGHRQVKIDYVERRSQRWRIFSECNYRSARDPCQSRRIHALRS